MVYRDTFRILSDEEKSQFKFEFCQGCALYDECEMVEQYARFRDNHPPIHKSQIAPAPSRPIRIEATAVRVVDRTVSPSSQTSSGVLNVNATVARDTTPLQPSVGTVAVGGSGMDRLSYNQEELKEGCIMSSRHVYPIACGSQRVADGIGDHYKIETRWDSAIETGTPDRWEPSQPVFISAQTGQGKNFFVENELIPYVSELNYQNDTNQKVLILSNRLALQQQIKNRLKGDDDTDDGEGKIYHYSDCADVMTYQSLLLKENRFKKQQANARSRYIYVICDEAHFFTSDAMFNPRTSKILSAIVRLFQDAVRVYMSATPYECLEYIIRYEREYQSQLNFNRPQEKDKSIPMAFYHFKRDYSYLDTKVYSVIPELYEIILESVDRRKEKWLIFIDDKEQGSDVKDGLLACAKKRAEERAKECEKEGLRRIVKRLEAHDESQTYDSECADEEDEEEIKAEIEAEQILVVNAGSKTNETYMEIVKKEELVKGVRVLITTSVLDNGVNLTGIKNVVVSDMAKVKCLQMVGRARVSGEDDRKTLYVKRFGGGEVESRIKDFKRQQAAYHSFNLAYGEPRDSMQSRGHSEYLFLDRYYNGEIEDWVNAKHWFGRLIDKPTQLYINEIAKSLLDRLVPQYKFIYDEMVEEAPSNESQLKEKVNRTGQKYLEYQLACFGKTYCVDDDIPIARVEKAREEFVAFLESYAESGEVVDTPEKMASFQDQFTKLYDAVFTRADKNRRRSYKYKKMNDLLQMHDMGYTITGQPQKGPWRVIRVGADQESPESEKMETPTIEDTGHSIQ